MKLNKKKLFKIRKGKLKKFNLKSSKLSFGLIGLKSLKSGVLSYKQIEAARKVIVKKTNYKIKVWIKLAYCFPVTCKPIGTRMGKGKGKIQRYNLKLKQGSILFEIAGPNKILIINALNHCKFKLPIKTKIFFIFLGFNKIKAAKLRVIKN